MMDGYNSDACITVGELRAAGIPFNDDIPDCAWTLKAGIWMEPVSVKQDESDSSVFEFKLGVHFLMPFKWVTGKYTTNTPEGTQRPV